MNPLRRPHDIGGTDILDAVETADDSAPFHHEWEARVFALNSALLRQELYTLDEFRDTLERLTPQQYHDASYYERWLYAIELLLARKGVLDAV